jgi:hypothetical protein
MPEPSQSVRVFVEDAYQLISAHSPTVPLHGNDLSKGVQFLNELLDDYSATGQLLTIARDIERVVIDGEGLLSIGSPDFVPTPDILEGRLVELINAWLILEGVTYPLIPLSTTEFDSSFKYEPLRGLPRYIIIRQETDISYVRIYPAPSQQFTLFIRAKFELSNVTTNDSMASLPKYYLRYLKFALASDLADYKGRSEAWTPKLEAKLKQAKSDMIAASAINLDVTTGDDSLTPAAKWRLISGL